jgi:hypothetical protein
MPGVTPGLTVSDDAFILEMSLSKPTDLRHVGWLISAHNSAKNCEAVISPTHRERQAFDMSKAQNIFLAPIPA